MTKTNKLRVLWISHLIPYPPKGGVLMRSYHLIREISKHHDVDLFAFNQSKLLSAYFKTQETGIEASKLHFSEFINNYYIEQIPCETSPYGKEQLALSSLFSRAPYTINWLRSKAAKKKLNNIITENKYDIVHFDTISLAPYLSDKITCPTVMDHHNIESHMLTRRAQNEKNIFKKLYYLQEGHRLLSYERKNLKKFSAHITCSSDDLTRLKEIDRTLQANIVPNGAHIPKQQPPRDPTTPLKIIFIGGLDWYPNRDAVIFFIENVWPKILKERKDIHFHVIGKNPSEKILNLASQSTNIFIHGFVDDISSFYESATLYVCPIMDGGGTKLKIIDAMTHGVPILAHPIACEGINVTNGDNVFMASSASEFADFILTSIDNRKLLEKVGDGGYELAKGSYDFGKIGENLSNLYCYLAENKHLEA